MEKKISFMRVMFFSILILPLFTQCYKEPTYPAVVQCFFVDEEGKKLGVAKNCLVEIGREQYADFAIRKGVTDAFGIYKTTFDYHAILDVNGYLDITELTLTSDDSLGMDYYELVTEVWSAHSVLKLQPDQEVTLELLLKMETDDK